MQTVTLRQLLDGGDGSLVRAVREGEAEIDPASEDEFPPGIDYPDPYLPARTRAVRSNNEELALVVYLLGRYILRGRTVQGQHPDRRFWKVVTYGTSKEATDA